MAACAIPTSPVDTGMVYADFVTHYQDAIGTTSSPTASSVVGQRITCAAEQAYWEIYNCISAWGVTDTDIADLFDMAGSRGPLATVFRWLAAYYWLSDSAVARDDPTFQRAERYKKDWEQVCANGGVLTKPDGTKIDLSASAGTAGQNQGEHSVRENSAGDQNDWRMQSTPLQFTSGSAAARVAGTKYGNKWDGGN